MQLAKLLVEITDYSPATCKKAAALFKQVAGTDTVTTTQADKMRRLAAGLRAIGVK